MVVLGALLAILMTATADDYVADALKALDAHQPAAAEPLLRKAIEADAGDLNAHFNLALSLSLQKKDAEAIAEYRKTLELKPGLYEADLNLGILLLRNQRPADALAPLKEAIEAKPKESRPHMYYAQALLDSGEAAQAEQNFALAAELDPRSEPAQLGLAQALLKQSKLPEAAEHFRTAKHPAGLLQVAAEYEKANRRDEAIAIYKEFPDDPAVREHLGRLQIESKQAADAIPNLEESVRKAPTAANRLALADAYKLVRQNAKMLEQLRLAAEADPNNFDIRMAWGRSLRDDRQLIPAAQQFLVATRLKPDAAPAWNELASALIVSENYPQGLAALNRVRALGKEIPGDYFLRAITLDKLRPFRLPLATYQQFLTVDNIDKARVMVITDCLASYKQFLDTDQGAHPDQEFQARQRMRIIENELKKK